MSNKLPDYRAHLGRHGHNLTHDFSFTSGTGHLLTLVCEILYPEDRIEGRCDMFTRTQPLLNPANVEIDEYIDYFFVPLDMIMSGFGDLLYQVNEPYSSFINSNLSSIGGKTLPVCNFATLFDATNVVTGERTQHFIDSDAVEPYKFDLGFFSIYRNLFHNFCNPNSLFANAAKDDDMQSELDIVYPVDLYQPNVLPLSLLAYNAVYQHYYRLDDREQFQPETYNIDSYVYDNESLFRGYEMQMLSLKYRPKHLDYFMDAAVAPFFNTQNMLNNGTDLLAVNNYLSSNSIIPKEAAGNPTSLNSTGAQEPKSVGIGVQVNTANIRSMFAVEKIMGVTQRARKTYDAQVLAHLGVKVPHDVLHQIIKIGTQHSQIKIGEVISTAGTSDTPLGDIAGKGYGVMGDDGIQFTAPCHGVFIGIYSAVPRFRYYAPLSKHMQISNIFDFFTPEFENLGLQPIFSYESMPLLEYQTGDNPVNSVLGWQMRYEQYKRRFNRVSPAFIDTIVKSIHNNKEVDSNDVYTGFNSWHNWTISRRPFSFYNNSATIGVTSSLQDFLCSPAELNGLMAVDYLDNDVWQSLNSDGIYPLLWLNNVWTATSSQRTSCVWNMAQFFYRDPLLHFCKPSFKVVNKMSDNTLPDFCD